MQSSVRSATPRQVTISASPSSTNMPLYGGVQIDREVVVTSHTRNPGRRASYSPIPPLSSSHGHNRTQSQEPSRTSSNRWESSSRVSERSTKRQSRPNLTQLESTDPVLFDTNRESMKALAEFLMTKEPPPNNWVSMHSDDEISLRTMKKYKIFGLQKKKKKKSAPKAPKFMKLPDVAVAATTLQGSRHIAISIPLEHDHPELLRPSTEQSRRPQSAPRLHTSDRGTVTVLKPVVEVRESASFSPPFSSGNASAEGGRVRATSVATPPIDILGAEATRTLENYYLQLHQQQKMSRAESKRPETSRGRTYIGVTPFSASTPKPDPRHSGGTIYSNATISTAPGHSRGVSSVSTVPSVNPINGTRFDLPPRKSSKSTVPAFIEEELRVESARIAALEQSTKRQILRSSNGSLKSDTSHSAPVIFGTATAETAKGYHSPGPQYFSRSNTPLASPAPTKKLPDLPLGAGGQNSRPSTAPLSKSSPISDINTKRTSSMRNNSTELDEATQQSRQERVKARKQRDMAAIRALVDESTLPTPQISQTPSQSKSSRSSKRRTSQDLATKKALNSFSPIMIVASLPPFTGIVLTSDLPSPPPQLRKLLSKKPSSASTVVRIHTPPRSIHNGSDSDTIPRPQSKSRSKLGSPVLEARRQERRTKRNMTLHEKELDARLSKIEKDNAMLLHTLSAIANSFGQFNRFMPESRGGGIGLVQDGTAGIEPLMRELQGNARVSKEFERPRRVDDEMGIEMS